MAEFAAGNERSYSFSISLNNLDWNRSEQEATFCGGNVIKLLPQESKPTSFVVAGVKIFAERRQLMLKKISFRKNSPSLVFLPFSVCSYLRGN
jgi:hypothetical protein